MNNLTGIILAGLALTIAVFTSNMFIFLLGVVSAWCVFLIWLSDRD